MLAWPVSIELIDLPFSHLSHVAYKISIYKFFDGTRIHDTPYGMSERT
jgi:hypothetical protein